MLKINFLLKSFEFSFNVKVPDLLNIHFDGDYAGGQRGFR